MKLLLLHLSDIHFRTAYPTPDPNEVANAAAAAAPDATRDHCILIVSGDIAFSGADAEYHVADDFLNRLIEQLKNAHHFNRVLTVIAPGNHDCDFSEDQTVRDILLSQLSRTEEIPLSDDLLSHVLRPQDHFFEFRERLTGHDIPQASGRLFYTDSISLIDGTQLHVHTVNTAWISQLHESQGTLCFPISLLPDSAPQDGLNVTVFHHPYNWMPADNARQFRTAIESFSDIIMTGHEHSPTRFTRTYSDDNSGNEFLEGGCLSSTDQSSPSSFNILLIDTDENTLYHSTLIQQDNTYYPTSDRPDPRHLSTTKRQLLGTYHINPQYQRYLNDAGASFTHPNVNRLTLDDIFVPPDLCILNLDQTDSRSAKSSLAASKLLSYLLTERTSLIVGPEQSGKSTLAKYIFSRLHADAIIPLIVDAKRFISPSPNSVTSLLRKTYQEQYSSPDYATFAQLPPRSKALIIDDLHLLPLNAQGQDALMSILRNAFEHIILIASDTILIADISGDRPTTLNSFCVLELPEFGHNLTEQLIEKWVSVGQEYSITDQEILQRVIQLKTILDSALGRALIPRRPLYLLALLQQVEASTQIDNASGSFGYLHEFLITQQLSRAAHSYSLDTLHNYLAELAFTIFETGKHHISDFAFKRFHKHYCQTYRIQFDPEKLLKDLTRLYIFESQNDKIRFRYKYLYYFFAAKYLSSHITEKRIRQHADAMIDHLHREDYATIILFATYFVKDPILLDRILQTARSLFGEHTPCDFEGHVGFINQLQEELPKLFLPNKGTRERREDHHKNIDSLESSLPNSKDTQGELDLGEDKEVAELLAVTRAFKTIQILGQILRTSPGSLKGDLKLDIAGEAYLLGLRTLNGILSIFDNNLEDVAIYIADMTADSQSDQTDRLAKAKQIICLLLEMVSFSVIKRISTSTGSRYLEKTYEDVYEKYNTLPIKLIDLSVKLDNFSKFPEERIIELHESSQHNMFAHMTLRQLVAHHLYLNPIDTRATQRICSKLGIGFTHVQKRRAVTRDKQTR